MVLYVYFNGNVNSKTYWDIYMTSVCRIKFPAVRIPEAGIIYLGELQTAEQLHIMGQVINKLPGR